MMAVLVDEGKFGWDTPVTQVLPSFAVGDAGLTKRLTMENMVCSCTGMPKDKLGTTFEWAGVSAETVLARMKDVKPTTAFGETFQYSPAMMAAAGYIAAHALYPKEPIGPAYDKAMKAKVFDPAGMKMTTFDVQAVKRAEHASPYQHTSHFEIVAISLSDSEWVTPLKPHGAAWSNIRDLSRYLLVELGRGKTPEGKQVVSEANLLKRREPRGHGFGMHIENDRDIQVVSDGGWLPGYGEVAFFLPEHHVGAALLMNVGYPNPLVYAGFRRKLLELLFDGRDEAREDLAYELKTAEAEMRSNTRDVDLEPDRAWLDRLLGTYEHPLYGKVTIRMEGNRGIFDVGEWKTAVGRKRQQDGSAALVFTTPPYNVGWTIMPKEVDGKIKLYLEDVQGMIVLEPVRGK